MPWGRFLRIKFGFSPAYLAACRYAIKPRVYSLFEDDDDLESRGLQSGACLFAVRRRRRRAFCAKSCLRERRRLPNLTTARPIL